MENFNVERARAFLFFPVEAMMDSYPKLLMSHGPEETVHPAVAKVQASTMAMFYLLHIRDWKLTRTFFRKHNGSLLGTNLQAIAHRTRLFLYALPACALLSLN